MSIVKSISQTATKIFGSRNERMVKRYLRIAQEVNTYESRVSLYTDEQIRNETERFKEIIKSDKTSIRDLMPEVFAVAREAMDRAVGIRSIFNPEHDFNMALLSDEMQSIYKKVKNEADTVDSKEPEGVLRGHGNKVDGWQFIDIPVELYAAVRKLYPESRPPFRARPFDVQIIGAIVLYEGRIAEMKTGEGKTIVAPLACYLSAIESKQVHVVTVNDYLVQRDRDWTFPFFRSLGLTVGAIHPFHMQDPSKKQIAYSCDVVYGTTSEFGFDYLRDNMKLSPTDQVQKERAIAIVDEVDSTLIDEARTPLIISGPAHEEQPRYELADELARFLIHEQKSWNECNKKVEDCLIKIAGIEGDIRNASDKFTITTLKKDLENSKEALPKLESDRNKYIQLYEIELDKKKATLTHAGIAEAQKKAGIGSFYIGKNIDLPHLLEQAVRAHTVYQRERDYVVAPDSEGVLNVVIVDQNTGRMMIGRQWSDGLHQAVEAKERVPIKQETQTMATITIQNYFKLYEKLSGMTGTADTEATEFHEIYSLDVVVIPTNVPIKRNDFDDLVFMSRKDKLSSIVDEIKHFHDLGRPILVGTTSVERSKELSDLLRKRYAIPHQVLNAEQHEKEGEIVKDAGQLGAVTISTNMAGRGTDIKLAHYKKDDLLAHWKKRGIAPASCSIEDDPKEIIKSCFQQLALKELRLKKSQIQEMDSQELELKLFRHWYVSRCFADEKNANKMDLKSLTKALDSSGLCSLHRIELTTTCELLGGLHVIGTERHESRRIDNQLRGRSGRQGDRGSSRFYLSLEDDLMQMFAGDKTKALLSRLGMKEGVAIESPMLTKAVSRAQRKVEERNFLVRKNILEYDEVMDHQRHSFYGLRQQILDSKGIRDLILEYLEDSTENACNEFLDPNYGLVEASSWISDNCDLEMPPERIGKKDWEDLKEIIIADSKAESRERIRVAIGEYLPHKIDLGNGETTDSSAEQSDYPGLIDWSREQYGSDLAIVEARDMSEEEIIEKISFSASKQIDSIDFEPLKTFLDKDFGIKKLEGWAIEKFGSSGNKINIKNSDKEKASEVLFRNVRGLYEQREILYPINFAMEMTMASMQKSQEQALANFCRWAKCRYDLDWNPLSMPSADPLDLHRRLVEEAKTWDQDKIKSRASKILECKDLNEQVIWLKENLGLTVANSGKRQIEINPEEFTVTKIKEILRLEVTQLERWLLLQTLDSSWKDHLYQMDQVRESIGYRSFSQRDPRIEYKREGARLFGEMFDSIRDKVTGMVLKAKLSSSQSASSSNKSPENEAIAAAAAVASSGTDAQRKAIAQAQLAGAKEAQETGLLLGRNEKNRLKKNNKNLDNSSKRSFKKRRK